MPQPLDDLTLKAAALARAAPENWREFVAALATFAEVHRENLVRSQLNELPVNQGRAQMAGMMYAHIRDAVVNSDKMIKKEPR